jgi:hypothetical protein
MSRFREEMNVIPGGAWVLAGIAYVALASVLFFVTSQGGTRPGAWHLMRVLFVFGIPSVLFFYVLFIGYVYRDAQRRGMRHILWTLLVIFIPNAIGFILYFILRDPLLKGCVQCGADIRTTFT